MPTKKEIIEDNDTFIENMIKFRKIIDNIIDQYKTKKTIAYHRRGVSSVTQNLQSMQTVIPKKLAKRANIDKGTKLRFDYFPALNSSLIIIHVVNKD